MTNGRGGSAQVSFRPSDVPSDSASADPAGAPTAVADARAAAVRDAKRLARRAARARRAAAHAAGPEAARAVADRLLAALPLPAGTVIAGYVPVRDELDVFPLLHAAHDRGLACALPAVGGPEAPLAFRAWRPGDRLAPGPFGVPAPEAGAAPVRPGVVVVPMLAFDRAGRRLGYGAGYYDRTLAALRRAGAVTAVGVAYAAQEEPAVPADGHDQPLDWIVTEHDAFRPGGPDRAPDRAGSSAAAAAAAAAAATGPAGAGGAA